MRVYICKWTYGELANGCLFVKPPAFDAVALDVVVLSFHDY